MNHLIDYIKEDADRKFDKLDARLNGIENKLDLLLQFKWQIIGGSAVISIVVALLVQLFSIIGVNK